MADTDIELAIDLNVTDAEKTAKDLQKEIEKIFESRNGEQSKSLTSLEIQMKKNFDTANKLREELLRLSETPLIPTEEFQEVDRQFDELTNKMEAMSKELNERYAKSQATGVYDSGLNELAEELDLVEAEYDRVNKQRDALMASGAAWMPVEETQEYQKLNMQLDATNDKLKQQIIHYQELADKEAAANSEAAIARQEMTAGNKSITALSMSIRGIGRLLPGVSTTGIMGITMVTKGIMRLTTLTKVQLVQALTALKAAFAKLFAFIMAHPIILVFTAIAAAVIAIVKVLKKWKAEGEEIAELMGEKLLEFLEKAKNVAKELISVLVKGFIRIGTLLPRAAVNFVQFLVNKLKSLKSTIEESLKLMAQWNDGMNETNTALSNLTSSLNYLKGSIAAAFTPILTTVEPILTMLIDSLAEVVNFVGMVIAKLSGATSYTKAVRVQTDYAKSLDKTAKSAKKANEQLASFDKLNVLNPDKGSGAVSAPVVDFAKMGLEETPLPDWLFDFEKLSGTLSNTINNFLKSIDWDYIKGKASMVGTDIADFINGLDFGDALGETLGEGLNTITTAVNSFLKKFKGLKLGERLGKLIKKAIETINWKDVGEMFSGGINQLSLMIIGFTDQFEGSELGKAFSEFLSGSLGKINWVLVRGAIRGVVDDIVGFLNEFLTEDNFKLVGTTLGELLNTIFTGINVFADGAKWKEWGENLAKGIEEFIETTDFTMGAEAIFKLFSGILDMVYAAVTKLMEPATIEKITDKIVDFISSLNFEEIGKKAKEISEKLITGLKKIWQALKDSGALNEIIKLIVDLMQSKEEWEELFKGFKSDIVAGVLKEKIHKIFSSIGEWFSSVLNEFIVEPFSYVWKQISGAVSSFWDWLTGDSGDKELHLADVAMGGPAWRKVANKANSISKLADGAVLPPNKPFLAIVGDQTNGTNVEAPLSTIQQAVADVMSNMGVKVVFDVKGDPLGIFKATQREATVFYNQHGYSAFSQ